MIALASTLIANASLFRMLNIGDGLPDSTIKCFCQDEDGFIWMGTFNGLCRYDGVHFETFRSSYKDDYSLSNSHIEALLSDGYLLWIGTENGMECLDRKTGHFRLLKEKDGNDIGRLHRITKVGGKIWVVPYSRRLMRISEDEKWVNEEKALSNISVMDCLSWGNDKLLICTNNGLFVYNLQNQHLEKKADLQIPSGADPKMYYDSSHRKLYIGLALGHPSKCFSIDADGSFRMEDFPLPTDVKDIISYKDDILWATDGKGLYRQNSRTHAIRKVGAGELTAQAIHSLFVDKENSLWIGSYRGYGAMYNPTFESFHTINDSKLAAVTTGIGLVGNKIVLGFDGKGIAIYDKHTHSTQVFNTSNGVLSGDNVMAMQVVNNKVWMIIYDKGIDCFDLSTHECQHFDCDVSNFSICKICNDKRGHLWFCGGSYVVVLDLKTGNISNFTKLGQRKVRNIAFGKDFCWVSCDGELLKLRCSDYKVIGRYSFSNEKSELLLRIPIQHMFVDNEGTLWLGAESGGLYRLYDGKREMEAIETLKDHVVVNIVQDNRNYLWICTQHGLYKYDKKAGTAVCYQNEDNLKCTQFYFNSSFKTDDDIYLGTMEGPVWFNPDSLRHRQSKMQSYFTSITMAGKKKFRCAWLTGKEQSIELDYDQNFFTVGFTCPEFVSPSKVKFSVWLENFDSEWQDIGGAREISYTNVPPGTYKLHLRATETIDAWNDETTTMTIIINHPWWQTWWANLLWGILALILIGGALMIYIHEMNLKHRMHISDVRAESQKKFDEEKMNLFVQVAHELRTPAFLISATMEEMLSSPQRMLSISRRKLESIYHNTQRLNKLVSNVIDLRKQDGRLLRLNEVSMDINKFCQGQNSFYCDMCKQKDITFSMDLPEESPIIKIDAEKLEMILNNLVSNAFKYTDKHGHVVLNIKRNNNSEILFSVTDNGIGISKEQQALIFEEYYRGDNHTGVMGDGVGLASAKHLAELMGGTILVESQEGIGSTFTLRLPIHDNQLSANGLQPSVVSSQFSDPDAASSPPTTLSTILIVDDEKETLQILQEYLCHSYKVLTASNGKEGWDMVQQHLPDLVITDMMMPEMNGAELLQLIKAGDRTRHIPIIMFTAKDTEEDKMEAFQQGADAYVSKPVSLKFLNLRIKNLLEQSVKISEMIPSRTDGTEILHSKEDKEFILKCRELMEKNLSNTQFDVMFMASELGMSHSTLYRRINKVTGMSAKDFINGYRLYRACQMIRQGETNVAAISEKCGFADYRTFSRTFKQKYGRSPKQFMQEH